ncbi:hypothetical protein AB0A98_41695, partial [Streptomyces chrestomyceticus]|uniref:hypothetical protein n=1 Tax=Streptomyces chrestomyceticus TaxID=68185 RepID=UPI0034022BD1
QVAADVRQQADRQELDGADDEDEEGEEREGRSGPAVRRSPGDRPPIAVRTTLAATTDNGP